MKRRTLIGGLAAGLAVPSAVAAGIAAADGSGRADENLIAITEQASNRILVFRRDDDWTDDNIVWSFSPGSANGWVDRMEIRFRATKRYGTVALTAGGTGSGAGQIGIVPFDPATKKNTTLDDLLWSDNPGTYPHGIERIPDVLAVVASGSRQGLHVYAQKNSDVTTLKKVQEIEFDKSHSLLWDRTYNVLWGVGAYQVRSFEVSGVGYDLRLKEVGDPIALPYNGHDVQPHYTDASKIAITDSDGVYFLDRKTRELSAPVKTVRKIKSYTPMPNGEAMWTVEDNAGDRPWAGPTVYFDQPDGSTLEKTREGAEIYKARPTSPAWT